MDSLKGFGRFWWKFIFGEDWTLAAGVIIGLAIVATLAHGYSNAWYVLPIVVALILARSLRVAIKQLPVSASSKVAAQGESRLGSLIKSWLILWLPLLMIALIPVLSGFLKNTSETSVQDLILPLVLNALVATIIAAAGFRFFLRQHFRFFLVAITLALILSNGYEGKLGSIAAAINSIMPFTIPTWLIMIGYPIVMVYLVCLLAKWVDLQVARRHWPTREIGAGIVIMISVVFISQALPTAQNLAAAWPQYFYKPPALADVHPTAAQKAAKPDIYYILLEDYTNQTVLSSQMNFDNSNFMQYLSGNGFYNVPAANANYPYTVNSVASTFNADYLSDTVNKFSTSSNQTMIPYFNTVRNSPVIEQLKSLGYSYDLLGDWYETSNYSPLANHTYTDDDQIVALNHTYSLDDFTDSELHQNILWGLISTGINFGKYHLLGYHSLSDTDAVAAQLSELKALASQPAGGRFIFSQILVPHNYFYYNADGSLNPNPTPDNVGELAKTKDTNEIQYINAQIKPVIDEIMKNSGGKANIILQSDEGPEPGVMDYTGVGTPNVNKTATDMTTWSPATLQMKFGVLASYYIPGASASDLAQAANPVNIFRLLLNNDFSDSLPYLPECYYGYPQGTNEAFVYKSIDQSLIGQSDPSCSENSNEINPGSTKLIKHPKKSSDTDND